MRSRLLLLSSLLVQTGCIGISVVTGTKHVELSKNIGERIGGYGNNETGTTTNEVLRKWGEPDTKILTEAGENWTYIADSKSWRGIQLWLIIPVPLLIPAGYHRASLEFTGNVLTRYTIDNARERYFGYFILNGTDRVWQFNTEEFTSGCHGYYGCY